MSQNFDLLKQIEYEQGAETAASLRGLGAVLCRGPELHFRPELMGLAQNVFLMGSGDRPRAVLFCGIDRENESSTICFELGRLLAAYSGRSVCLVDGDVHESRLMQRVNESRIPVQNDSWRAGCAQIAPNLWAADADLVDPAHQGVLPEADALRTMLIELKRSFYFVIINAPGLNDRNDAGVLGQIADATVLVIEANSTRRAAALKAKQSLQSMNVHILGTVLNNRTFPIPEQIYSRL